MTYCPSANTTTTTVTHRVSRQTRPRTASGCSQVPGLGHLGWYGEQTVRGPLKEGRRGCLSEVKVDISSYGSDLFICNFPISGDLIDANAPSIDAVQLDTPLLLTGVY